MVRAGCFAVVVMLSAVVGVPMAGAGTSCTIVGTVGADTLWGTEGPDVICALGGDDEIFALGGDDVIYGGPGNDTIDAGPGNDRAFGLAGHDEISGGAGDDRVGGGAGDDTLRGDAGNDKLWGGSGDDDMQGGSGSDLVWGDGGDDRIYAFGPSGSEEGSNILGGGPGFDELYGSDGRDLIYPSADGASVDAGAGSDVITGGATDLGDLIIRGGPGNDRVSFPFADNRQRLFDRIDIDLGEGDDTIVLVGDDGIVGIEPPVAGDVTIITGPGDDFVDMMLIGEVTGSVVVDLGSGDDTFRNFNEWDVFGDVSVELGDGTNVLRYAGTQEIRGDYVVNGGEGRDTISGQLIAAGNVIGGSWIISTKGGADFVEVNRLVGSADSTLQVNLGAGTDAVWVQESTISGNPGSFLDGGENLDGAFFDEAPVPRNNDGSAALPGIGVVTGTPWEDLCARPDFDDSRCPR